MSFNLYNSFFNLPEHLVKDLDTNRRFEQIDLFPMVLEIAGFDLPNHKAGMGTSVFGKEKTIAEKYSKTEQGNIFLKIDKYYINLWQ